MPLRSLMSDAIERMQVLQTELQLLDQERNKILQRIEAMRVLLEWEQDRDGNANRQELATAQAVFTELFGGTNTTPASNGTHTPTPTINPWAGVSVGQAVKQVYEAHPEWHIPMKRSILVWKIVNTLHEEGFDFQGKLPFNSVNVSLNRILPTKSKKGEVAQVR